MARQAVSKVCVKCGHGYATKRPDLAKYCDFCAAVNGILHFRLKQTKCFVCAAVFCPTTSNDILCSTCDTGIKFCRATVSGNCISCDRRAVTVADKDVPVCFHCWKSPTVRPKLLRALAKKRAERIAANNEGDA